MEQKVIADKEFEHKYLIQKEDVRALMTKVRKTFPGSETTRINYTDVYFLKNKFEFDKYVPYFVRLRAGDSGVELTTKSLKGCGPNERNEKNQTVKSVKVSAETLKSLEYTPVFKLVKSCEFITTEELWITMDKVIDDSDTEAYYFEIEVAYPTSSESALKLLEEAETALGLTEEERIDDLLFEIYSNRRLMRSI